MHTCIISAYNKAFTNGAIAKKIKQSERDDLYVKKTLEKNKKRLEWFLRPKKKQKTITQQFKSSTLKEKKTPNYIFQSKDKLYYPLEKNSFWISARFGMRKNSVKNKYEMHHGVDFAAPQGTPIKAASSGIVEKVGNDIHGWGKYVLINHKNGIKTRYAHMSKIIVKRNEPVIAGTIIGLVGATGNTRGKNTGAHLHFELIINNKRCNPLPHLIW